MKHNYDKKRFDDSEVRSKMQLLAELQIHQAELELQNFELKNVQRQLEESRNRYADLYDYAPIGYLTLDKEGCILETNLTGSKMLNIERAFIVGKPFTSYLVKDDNRAFLHYLRQTFNTSDNTTAELRIKSDSHKEKHVRLESSVVKDTNTCRMVMTDIDQLKETTHCNQKLLQGNRLLMQNIFKIQEEERRHLSCDLHDELGQWLTAIHVEAEMLANLSQKNPAINSSALAISACVKETHSIMRNMLHQLRPVLLDTLGLEAALLELKKHWRSHNYDITINFKFEGELDKLGEHINITIYRIVQEALSNICSHAQATRAQIHLNRPVKGTAASNTLLLSVEDNGKGYKFNQKSKGLGMLGMRERTIAAGGKFTVSSAPSSGTLLTVKLPLDGLNKRRKADEL